MITCDYLPENPGHRYADESYNVSTTDEAAVLELARRCRVDGVLAFASDPAAPTAASVAAELNLPGAPPEAVRLLCNKPAFRAFLWAHGFKAPRFAAPATLDEVLAAAEMLGFPIMVKPCDSSGSKGVSRVEKRSEVEPAYRNACRYSRSGTIVMEQWLARQGRQIAGDGLVVDGKLVFGGFGDEHFDAECCPHAPVGESFPGHLAPEDRARLMGELQRLFTALGIRNLVFNLDAMIDAAGDVVIIEIGPRAGGNCLPDVIRAHTSVDLADIAVRLALGEEVHPSDYTARHSGFHASWMIHSRREGNLTGYSVDSSLTPYIRELEFLAKPGTPVRKFSSSAETLGYAVLEFPSMQEMQRELTRMPDSLQPVVA